MTKKESNMRKVIRNGQVAVLYSPGFGSGWFTWNREHPQCLYDPDVVNWIENSRREEELPDLKAKYGDDFFVGSAWKDLTIAWLPVGTQFRINEYDGHESIVLASEEQWLFA